MFLGGTQSSVSFMEYNIPSDFEAYRGKGDREREEPILMLLGGSQYCVAHM